MARDGYARMSIDAVAAAAGVSKPTLYRRYPTKAALATAAIAHLRDQTPPRETGRVHADLVAHLRDFQDGVERPFGVSMVGTVLAEEHQTPELLERFRDQVVQPRRRMLRAVLERGQARGELRPDADLDTATAMLIGAYYAEHLARGRVTRDWPERTVTLALAGLAPTG